MREPEPKGLASLSLGILGILTNTLPYTQLLKLYWPKRSSSSHPFLTNSRQNALCGSHYTIVVHRVHSNQLSAELAIPLVEKVLSNDPSLAAWE